MMGELKPCPHCGGLGELVRDEPITGAGFVECHDCGARGGISTYANAVRLWNMRVERKCTRENGWCSNCGLFHVDGIIYCPYCGAKVVEQ